MERICENCGDDLAADELPFCIECLENTPALTVQSNETLGETK